MNYENPQFESESESLFDILHESVSEYIDKDLDLRKLEIYLEEDEYYELFHAIHGKILRNFLEKYNGKYVTNQ